MRTLILVVFSCFVLSLGYLAYWWMQPARAVRVGKAKGEGVAALPLAKTDADRPFGPGKRVWVKRYDEDTAKLASRFRAEDYAPRADGWVVVRQPRAQFFMKDGRAISIQGESGEVIMDDQRKGMKALSGSRETPSRGRLNNVTIYLYHGIDHPEQQLDEEKTPPKAAMTITLNNASFDNQTFKIYSEGYGRGRNHVAADQVPVTLRGDDYDFDGRGLTIRWNERDRRLQLLEVAHGERLVIKRPNSIMKKQPQEEEAVVWGEGGRGRQGEGETGNWLADLPLPVMLAAKNRGAAGEAIRQEQQGSAATAPTGRRARPALPKPKITPSQEPPLYRAIFHDDVKIVQGGELAVTGNRMSVDFLLEDQGDSTAQEKGAKRKGRKGAATQASTAPVTQPAGGATTQASARRVRHAGATPAPATQPGGDEKPVVITWTGKLVVEPLAVGQENPIKNGEAVVRLDGTPVTATDQGSTIQAGSLTYRTEDQAMLLTPIGPDRPVVLRDTKGAVVHTARMDFFQPKRQAVLYGVSDAVFPQEDAAGKPGAPLLAKWNKTCTLYFADAGGAGGGGEGGIASGGAMNIERAELDGSVAIDHPQLKLKSNALDLTFDNSKAVVAAATRPAAGGATTQATGANQLAGATSRPTTRPAVRTDLRRLVATGAVHCEMTDGSKKTQTIDCNRLSLQTAKTADGRLYPDTVNADGDVRAVDPEQDLRAEHLAVTLRPTTRPSAGGEGAVAAGGAGTANAELQSMVAHQNVVVVSKDGTRTTADQLLVDSKDGHNNLKLLGQPYATIVDKKNTLQGPIIEIFPDIQQLQIVGPGKMRGVQQDKAAGGAERPIDVTWQRAMAFDGRANTVDVTGQVVAVTTDAEGARNTARGERVTMLLADAQPTTKPTSRPTQVAVATSRPAATQPLKSPNNAMASKTVRQITFEESATVSSESWGADGSLLRRTHLEASTLRYDLLAKQMEIPVGGRMIVEDHRPASTQPAGKGPAGEARPASATGNDLGGGSNRGKTAFQWSKSFTYDEGRHEAVMLGDERNPVIVVHQDDSPKAQVFRLTGQRVTAELEPAAIAAAGGLAQQGAGAGAPTTKPGSEQQKMQLKRVTAAGRLVFTGPGAEIRALNMEFDPTTHWLTARGTEREMVDFSISSSPGGSKQAEEVRYNLESGEVKSTKMMIRMAR